MSASPEYWAIVPAAGAGTRFALETDRKPKQYQRLGSATIAEKTLSILLSSNCFKRIVVALAVDDTDFARLPMANHDQIATTEGGASRAHSVLNALRSLRSTAAFEDWVLVHDLARPLLAADDLQALITTCVEADCGGILVAPIYDTVKESILTSAPRSATTPALEVKQTHSRDQLWLAQTPQMFRYGELLDAMELALSPTAEFDAASVTDEAAAMERAGHRVLLVPGSAQNIKVTTRADLALAQFYLEQSQ